MGDTSAEILRHRRACDLCLLDECDKSCEHLKEYTYQEIQRAYDEAIGYLTSRPRICQNCGRGCFSIDKFCPHCGEKIK